MAKNLPDWCKNAKIAMIERDLTVADVAKGTDMARPYVSSIVNGRVFSEKAVKRISDYLDIPDADSNFAFASDSNSTTMEV